jgi:hypothetical protein
LEDGNPSCPLVVSRDHRWTPGGRRYHRSPDSPYRRRLPAGPRIILYDDADGDADADADRGGSLVLVVSTSLPTATRVRGWGCGSSLSDARELLPEPQRAKSAYVGVFRHAPCTRLVGVKSVIMMMMMMNLGAWRFVMLGDLARVGTFMPEVGRSCRTLSTRHVLAVQLGRRVVVC